ncbi:MAG TPA: tetratricopeptide repeat protein [Blastocatellia bacterium]|nr:tetratricopeptide repeat protein [Blastocatellia bacterium]
MVKKLSTASPAIQAGQVLGNYRVVSLLGAGGMGEVYLAEDLKLGRKVAIKLLLNKGLDDDLARKRLIREAKAAAKLDHPNIRAIYEVNDEGSTPFIVMQYVEGDILSTKIKQRSLEPLEVVEIGVQMAEALVEAHSRRIIHRDIKPLNVIVTARGQIKILDFGLAKLLPEKESVETEADTLSQLTDKGQVVGTVGYMSPEQLKGEEVDSRTDIFSLGVLLYNCATGKTAFTGSSTIQICLKVIQSEPPRPTELNPGLPAELERIIIKAMAKDSAARYQSAGEMLADLLDLKATLQQPGAAHTRPTARMLPSLPIKVPATAPVLLASRLRKNRFKIALVIAPLLLVALIWAAMTLFTGAGHQPPPEARVWYERGTNSIREGAYHQATRALARAIELDGRYALAHARLAEAYMEIDSPERASDEVLTALALVPDRTALPKLDAIYLNAITATVRRELTAAINYYREIAEQSADADKPSAYMDLGRSYEKNENIDKAIELYEEAARLAPESPGPFLRAAILYGRKQDFKRATENFDKAERIYRDSSSNLEGVAEVYFQRGAMLNKINKVKEARVQLEKALDIARQSQNQHQQVRAQLQLSAVYVEENTDRARSVANEAIDLAQANNLRSLAVNGLIDLGYVFTWRGEFDEAGKYFKQALEFARVDKARKSEARAVLAMGSLSLQQANDDEAIQLIEKALTFYQPSGYRKETSVALSLLGRAQSSKGNYEEATKIFTQQLSVSEELGDSAMLGDAHLSLALTLGLEQERYPEALPHVEESYKINKASGSPMYVGYDQMNRALILWRLGRYQEARDALGEALSIAARPEAEYKALQAWVHLIYAQIALSERKFAEARKKGQQALELSATQFKDVAIQAKYCVGLAEALSGAARPAIQACQEAVAVAREIKSPRLVSSALLALAEVMLEANDAAGALRAALEAQEMFARAGRQDSEWRALLVAARASQAAGNAPQASDYAARADGLLSTLQQSWDAEAFGGYARRPDIESYRNQLGQLLRPNK